MKKVLLPILLLIPSCLFAQQIRFTDSESGQLIESVIVRDKKGNLVYSGTDGIADVSGLKLSDSLFISRINYLEMQGKWEIGRGQTISIPLLAKENELDEFVISANRVKEERSKVLQKVITISAEKAEFTNSQTMADLLQNSGEVFVQRSQMGGGSPVLRGFEANKVLLVLDGVRMNNAIYRSGHLQDVITVDQNMLQSTEVLFGPSSVMYGSDAMGGVIVFNTKKPVFGTAEKKETGVNAMIRYSTANNENSMHLDFNRGNQRWASLTSISYSKYGDLRTGNIRDPRSPNFGERPYYAERIDGKDSTVLNPDKNVQVGTAYKQVDLMQKISFKQNKYTTHNLNLQMSTSSDIPRYDRLSEYRNGNMRFAEWYYGPQLRTFAAYSVEHHKNTRLYETMKVIFSHQYLEQERNTRNFNDPLRETQQEQVNVAALNIDLSKTPFKRHKFYYGGEFVYNDVKSTAFTKNIVSEEQAPGPTRYPGGGSYTYQAGIYLSHQFNINKKWSLNEAIRLNAIGLNSEFTGNTLLFDSIANPYAATTVSYDRMAANGSVGAAYLPRENLKFGFILSQAFRAPNVDDIGKQFEIVPGRIVVPNPDVSPEKSYSAELSMHTRLLRVVKLDVSGFYTLLNDVIVTAPAEGFADSVSLNADYRAAVVSYQNRDKAYVYGAQARMRVDFDKNFSFLSSLTYTEGVYKEQITGTEVPLDHIPPVFGQSALNYNNHRNFECEFFVRYNGWKRIADYNPNGEDNQKYALAEGMPSWYTLNARATYSVKKRFFVGVGLENIADVHYRIFASGISAPGRNFIISLRVKV